MKIKDNSKLIEPGDTFIALKKINDGHDYIEDAIKKGATTIIAEHGNYSVDTILVNNTHEYLVEHLYNNYYDDIKDLTLIGMTGTNGKTTTCYLLYQALIANNINASYIGTIGFYIKDKIKSLDNTTPDILEIYDMLLRCKRENVTHVIMEVSSHSLSMNRIKGLIFKYGVFTNLTQDHLDYHKTLDNYISAKQKLFQVVTDKSFINIDDKYKNCFLYDNSITYGFNNADYNISDIEINLNNSKFKLNKKAYKTNLIGKHNIYNISVVIAILNELRLDDSVIEKLNNPPGRMEIINIKNNIAVVDYAHTPDAVSNVIKTAKELNPNNIITIIGCGGDRDKMKRPIMGEIATNYSDFVIFTSDNPRNEIAEMILNDITKDLSNENYMVIENREEAIKKGIQMLENNDILLVLGKGHETYQIINNQKTYFNDKEIILKHI